MNLILLLLLILPSTVWADSQALTALTDDSAPTSDDLLYEVNSPGGTPGDRKLTLGNLKTFMSASPTLVTPILGAATGTSLTLSGALTASNITAAGLVPLATSLNANGANCSSGQAPLGVDASGAAEGCYDIATQVELDAAVSGSSGWTVSSPNVTLATPSNNVGIGSATPGAKVDVTGNIRASSTISGSNLTGSNTGDQTISVTGDITCSGTSGSTSCSNAAIGATKVTNAMLAGSIAASKLVGTDIATVGTVTAGTWNGTTVATAYGGTGLTSATDDGVMLGNGTLWQLKTIGNCTDSSGNHLNYTAATNTFSCGTSTATGSVGWTDGGTVVSLNTSTDNVGIGTITAPNKLTVSGTVSATTFTGGDWTGNAVPYNYGGTGLSSASDDNVMVGSGIGWSSKALASCTDTGGNHMNYDTSTNTFSCGTTSSGSGGFTDDGTIVHLSTASDNVGMGTTTPLGTLTLAGRGTAGLTKALSITDSAFAEKLTVLDNGNVGIGSTNPRGVADFNGAVYLGAGAGSGTISGGAGLNLSADGGTTNHISILTGGNVGVGTIAPVGLFEVGARKFTILSGGNIGVGSITPGTVFDVQGGSAATALRTNGLTLSGNGVATGNVLVTNSVGVGTWMSPSSIGASGGGSGTINSGTTSRVSYYSGATTLDSSTKMFNDNTNVGIGTIAPRTSVEIGAQVANVNGSNLGVGTTAPSSIFEVGVRKFNVLSGGNVGIGSITPGVALDVQGAIRTTTTGNSYIGANLGIGTTTVPQVLYVAGTGEMQAFKMNLNAANGYVLVANSVGVGTWMSPSSIGAGGGGGGSGTINSGTTNRSARYTGATTVDSSVLIFDDATNVGIGTIAPRTAVELGAQAVNIVSTNVGVGSVGPTNKLQVNGTSGTPFNVTNGSTSEFSVTSAGVATANAQIVSGGSNTQSTIADGLVVNSSAVSSANGGDFQVKTNVGLGTFFVSATTGNLGIGSLNPGAKLDIMGGRFRTVGIGTTVPQAACIKADGSFGYYQTTTFAGTCL